MTDSKPILRLLQPARKLIVITAAVALVTLGINLALPLFTQVFADSIISDKHPEWQEPMSLLLSTIFVISVLLIAFTVVFKRRLQLKFLIEKSSDYFWSAIRLPMESFAKYGAGSLLARYSSGYSSITSVMLKFIPSLVMGIQVLLMLAMIIIYSPLLSLVSILCVVANFIALKRARTMQKALNVKYLENSSELQSVLMAGIGNIELIKAAGAEDAYFMETMDAYAKTIDAGNEINRSVIRSNVLPALFQNLTSIISLSLGAVLIIKGSLTVGALLAFQGFLNQFISPVTAFTRTMQVMNEAKVSCDRMLEIEDAPKDVESAIEYNPDESYSKLSGTIEMRHVTFGYDRNLPPLLDDFSLTVRPGQSIALVGCSGSGKSTVANLIAGIYQPWSGEILFDGEPRNRINRHRFYNSVSVINQDITLFEGTIADNIKMWDSQIEDFAMIMAAKDAQIHYDIAVRPDGYSSLVANGGNNFSGGQRQRLEIATAIAKEPTILIMDEATSALDPITEAKVMDAIRAQGITTVTVAHRLSTIRDCDEIIVLDNGRVKERGTHQDLIKDTGGLYYEMMKYSG